MLCDPARCLRCVASHWVARSDDHRLAGTGRRGYGPQVPQHVGPGRGGTPSPAHPAGLPFTQAVYAYLAALPSLLPHSLQLVKPQSIQGVAPFRCVMLFLTGSRLTGHIQGCTGAADVCGQQPLCLPAHREDGGAADAAAADKQPDQVLSQGDCSSLLWVWFACSCHCFA